MPSLVRKRSRGGGDRASQAPKMRRSCDACAFAKRKCDGEVCCSLCRKKSIPCVYSKRQKSGPKVNTPPERGSAAVATSAASRSSPKADKRPLSDLTPTAAGPLPKKRALSTPTAVSKSQQPPHQRQQKADQSVRKKQSGASPAVGGGPQQRKPQKKQKQQQRQQQDASCSSLADAGRSQATSPNPKASIAESKCPPAAPVQPSSSSSSSPKKNLSAKALPRQQPKTVAKKEPRPRHKHKDDVGCRAPSSTNEILAARAAVVSPVKKSGGGKAPVVSPPVPPPLAVAKPGEEIAAAASAAATATGTATAMAELVPLPVVDPQRKILPVACSPGAPAVSLSESSVDGGSSSLSWDDVSDVFASSMDDDVLWSCDDFSETGARGAGVGIGSEEFFPIAPPLHGLQPELDKMRTTSPSVVEAVLLNDDESAMSWPIASGFGIPQLQPSTSSSPIPSCPLPPQVFQKCSSIPSPGSLDARSSGGGVERVLLPSGSGSTGGHEGSFGNNGSGIIHSGDGANNPISTWTPEAVEAGASTLLAVLSSTEFCGRDDSTGDVCLGEGLRQQRNQQLRQQQQQQHRYILGRGNGNKTVNDHDSARQSLRWPPNHNIPACDGRPADYGGMVPRSPPPAPSGAPSFAAVASQQRQPQQSPSQHHHRQRRQQQQRQHQHVSGSLNSRSSASVMPMSMDGNCTASWVRKGSERHQVATL